MFKSLVVLYFYQLLCELETTTSILESAKEKGDRPLLRFLPAMAEQPELLAQVERTGTWLWGVRLRGSWWRGAPG
jgi:hypothetical protein